MKLMVSILLATGLLAAAQDAQEIERARSKPLVFGHTIEPMRLDSTRPLIDSPVGRVISSADKQAAAADIKARYGITIRTPSDIGATPDQLKLRYGKLDKVEKAWCGGTAYGFLPSKSSYVYAIVAPDQTTISDVMYTKFKGEGNFTDAEKDILATTNKQSGAKDWRDAFLPKGRRERHNELTHNKAYWIQHESINAPATITNNFKECEIKDGPDNDNGWHGFQIRTEDQFLREQNYIKVLKKEAEEKYRNSRSNGAPKF